MFFRQRGADPRPEVTPGGSIEDFRTGWRTVRAKYLPPDPNARPTIHFDVTSPAYEWVAKVDAHNSRDVKASVYGAALTVGVFALYAGLNERTPQLVTPGGQRCELPEMRAEFEPGPDTRTLAINATPTMWSLDSWARFDGGKASWLEAGGGGPHRAHLVHAGLHVLGGLTMMPRGSVLGVVGPEGEPMVGGIRVPFHIASPDLFPHELIASFTPPRPEAA